MVLALIVVAPEDTIPTVHLRLDEAQQGQGIQVQVSQVTGTVVQRPAGRMRVGYARNARRQNYVRNTVQPGDRPGCVGVMCAMWHVHFSVSLGVLYSRIPYTIGIRSA